MPLVTATQLLLATDSPSRRLVRHPQDYAIVMRSLVRYITRTAMGTTRNVPLSLLLASHQSILVGVIDSLQRMLTAYDAAGPDMDQRDGQDNAEMQAFINFIFESRGLHKFVSDEQFTNLERLIDALAAVHANGGFSTEGPKLFWDFVADKKAPEALHLPADAKARFDVICLAGKALTLPHFKLFPAFRDYEAKRVG